MGKDFWAIIGVGVVLLGVVLSTWMASRSDTRENIRDVEKNLRGDIDRVHGDINRVEDNLKADINRVEDNINRVHGDVRILLEHALRGSERQPENAQD